MRTLNPFRSPGISASSVVGASADLMLVANGVDLGQSRFPAADLAQSGMSTGTVVAHGAILVVLGVLPVIALLAAAAARSRPVDRDRLSRVASGAFLVTQSVAVLAALATAL